MRSRSREDVSATSMFHSFILFSNFVLFVFHVGTTWNFVLPRLLAFTQAQKERDITLNLLLISCIRTKCSDQATKQRSSGDQVAIKERSSSALSKCSCGVGTALERSSSQVPTTRNCSRCRRISGVRRQRAVTSRVGRVRQRSPNKPIEDHDWVIT
jgi:hypothetical protein